MKENIAKFVLNYPKIVIAVSFVVTLILAVGVRNIRIDDNFGRFNRNDEIYLKVSYSF